jgi:hypothetical protein
MVAGLTFATRWTGTLAWDAPAEAEAGLVARTGMSAMTGAMIAVAAT